MQFVDDTPAPWKRFTAQILVTVISIAALWLTSLRVAHDITGLFITIPTFQSVEDSFIDSYKKISDEKERYETCLSSNWDLCNRTLTEGVERELER